MQSRNAKLHSLWEERSTLNFFLISSKPRPTCLLQLLQASHDPGEDSDELMFTIEWLESNVRGSLESSRLRRRIWGKRGWTGVPLTIWFLSKNYLPILFQLFSGQRNMCHFNPCYNVRVKGRLSILQVRH